MPRGLSSTILPAGKVGDACAAALAKIAQERDTLRVSLLKDFMRGRPFMSIERALRTLPASHKTIIEEYRKHDRDVLGALRSLSAAAYAASPDFTVEITADDFRLISGFYDAKSET